MAQIEADQVDVVSESFDLKDLCQEVVNSFRPLAAEKGLELSCKLHDMNDSAYLSRRMGDQQKIHQILTNLLSNAVKFTDRGEISLTADVGYGSTIRLVLEDSGRGISKEQQQKVFQPFSSDSSDGTGLGLSICQQYVKAMGGSISLASELGLGSTFTLELELPEDGAYYDSKVDWAKPVGPKVRPQFGLRVLSVDDDEVNRRVVERHLQQFGCQVDSVENGKQAVERFDDGYDLVLMDLLMPQMDGFQAAREIRRIEQEQGLGPVRIVAITASVVGKVEEQCRQAGMDGFLSKPFSKQQLQEVLNESKKDLDG